jgi:PAS domain S-box-containing protein
VSPKENLESELNSNNPTSSLVAIIYVDDEPGILEAVKITLEETGRCRVDTAQSVLEALEKLEEKQYDAIVADYIMPDIDGIRFLQLVREKYGEIPFILYTGVDRGEVLIEAINNGVNYYFQKGGDPIPQFVDLLHVIEQAVLKKQTEKALKESEERYRSIIENIIDIYFQIDREGKFILVSPSAMVLLGYDSLDEIVTVPFSFFLNDPQEGDRILRELNEQGIIRDYEFVLQKKDGTPVPVSLNGHLFRDENRGFSGFEGIIRDISERKKAEEELKRRNQDLILTNEKLSLALKDLLEAENELATRNRELKKQQEDLNQSYSALREANRQLNLLSSITRHDILNKVTILNGFLSIIRDEVTDPAITEYLDIIESTTNTIQSQIAFTRIYQDLGTHEPQWISVHSLLSSMNTPDAIRVLSDISDIEILADPISGKVFENLLDNTIRHGEHASQVKVTTREGPEGMTIIWEDDGAGIRNVDKERIFERGFGKNTGLGLFLVREILSITGIQITETGIEGKGARFEILVPEGYYRFTREREKEST